MKVLWLYMLDNCDPVGVWDVNLKLAQFQTGEQFTRGEIDDHLSKQFLEFKPGKWLILDFVPFQYGRLSKESRPHQSYLKILENHGIDQTAFTTSGKGIYTPKEKEKEKEKEKDKDKAKEKTKMARKPDPIWDAVCDTWGFKAETQAEQRRVCKLVRDYRLKLAGFDDPGYTLGRLVKDHRKKWQGIEATADSVLKHFDTLGGKNRPKGGKRPTSAAKPIQTLTDEQKAEAAKVRRETSQKLFNRKESDANSV